MSNRYTSVQVISKSNNNTNRTRFIAGEGIDYNDYIRKEVILDVFHLDSSIINFFIDSHKVEPEKEYEDGTNTALLDNFTIENSIITDIIINFI